MNKTAHDNHTPPDEPTTTDGKVVHFDATAFESGVVSTGSGNDTIYAHTDGKISNQVHAYAGKGDDTLYLDVGVSISRNNMHGHHVFTGEGADRIVFTNIDNLVGTVVGRLDDFDARNDTIWIGNQQIDLSNPRAITGYDVKIVSYQGQQWLDIKTENGRAFYTLEGARAVGDAEEAHFLSWNHDIPANLPEVKWTNPDNAIAPHLLDHYRAENVIDMKGMADDHRVSGTDMDDHITTRRGDDSVDAGGGNDLIETSWGRDTVHGGAGNDMIDGYKGLDLLHGDEGDDTIAGGIDSDTLFGGSGNDHLYGGSENDLLHGDEGDDTIIGGSGDDTLYSGSGEDVLDGGLGNDWLYAEGETAIAAGGGGTNTYALAEGTKLTITDFNADLDRLNISEYFTDVADLAKSTYSTGSATIMDAMDLVIKIPGGGTVVVAGQGHLAEHPARLVTGWEDRDPDDGDDGHPPTDPEDDPEDDDDTDDDAGAGDDAGGGVGGIEIGLIAALLGGLMLLGRMGGGMAP